MERLYKSEIHKLVKAFLDELGDNDAEFMLSDNETQNLEDIMDSVTPMAVRAVHDGAPNYMLDGNNPAVTDFSIDNYVATATLPDNFMRLVRVKLSSWGAPVTQVITEDSPEYRMQANKYMRGSYNKPVCALVRSSSGKQVLELYSAKLSSDDLQQLLILTEPQWGTDAVKGDDYIEICPRLKSSIIAQITGQLLLAISEDQRAQTFLSLSSNYSQ